MALRGGQKAGIAVALLAVAVWLIALRVDVEYAYLPERDAVVAAPRLAPPAYDLWGERIDHDTARRLAGTPEGAARLHPGNGAVRIAPALVALGRKAFYAETYGNELFLTDVLGMLDGPVDRRAIAKALWKLGGRGTSNLQVELSHEVVISGRRFAKGEVVDTGLDVPRGAWQPLGIVVRFVDGALKAGISCALCHATVDDDGRVIEGAPNRDLRVGPLMAFAPNSAAFYPNSDADPADFGADPDLPPLRLPGAEVFESAVDAVLMRWPPGSFDSTIDLEANPTQIPDSFTRGDFPYGWSGFASAGPFNGLSALGNNVHAQNSDSTALVHLARPLFGVDPEVHLATVLRGASHPRYRYTPAQGGDLPSAHLARLDPTPWAPGLNELVVPPTYPRITSVVPDGIMISAVGARVWERNNAMSAFQDTLAPPAPPLTPDASALRLGRAVFARAGCGGCHGGPYFTDNRIVPAPEVGTEPSRAGAFRKTEPLYEPKARLPGFDQRVPPESEPVGVAVPPPRLSAEQLALAMAYGGSPGGYKVKGLIGLWYSAPYLHDGGVAVGPDPERDLGLPGTLLAGVDPDPANSLRALVDRRLRERVVAANREAGALSVVHVDGRGHAYWVDEAAGFRRGEQDALIHYLLLLGFPPEELQ